MGLLCACALVVTRGLYKQRVGLQVQKSFMHFTCIVHSSSNLVALFLNSAVQYEHRYQHDDSISNLTLDFVNDLTLEK